MGIIYIAQNQTYGPNVYKVGKTERTNVRERMQELTGDTGVLGEFNELGWALVDDVNDCEKKCHTKLNKFRIQQNREFFRIDLETLVPLIRNNISEKIRRDKFPEVEIFLYPSHIIWMALTIGLQKISFGDNIRLKDFCASDECHGGGWISFKDDLERMPPQHCIDQWPLLSHMHYDGQWTKKRYWGETVDWAITHKLENTLKEFLDDLSREHKSFTSKDDAKSVIEKIPLFQISLGNETFNVSTRHFIEDGKLKENLWPPTSLNNQGGHFIENAKKFYGKPKIWTGWKIDKKNKKLLYVPHSKEFPLV